MVGAPDVALVAVLVETVFTLVFVGVFSRLPPTRPRPAAAGAAGRRRTATSPRVVAGVGAFAVDLGGPVAPDRRRRSDAAEQIRRTPAAHGRRRRDA